MNGLRACLLSGGASRRMGSDKALLPHPGGGTWLEFSLARLAALPVPITLLSHHPAHRALAGRHRDGLGGAIEALEEPPPRQGPLLALHRLMEHHPDQSLLLCPVDMPWLETAALEALVAAAAAAAPEAIHLAHDGERLQPLLGVYPAHARHRRSLARLHRRRRPAAAGLARRGGGGAAAAAAHGAAQCQPARRPHRSVALACLPWRSVPWICMAGPWGCCGCRSRPAATWPAPTAAPMPRIRRGC